jgi:hypothetical protein
MKKGCVAMTSKNEKLLNDIGLSMVASEMEYKRFLKDKKQYNLEELELSLNKLCKYVLDKDVKVNFNTFRGFPYISKEDTYGLEVKDYTFQEYCIIKFIRNYLKYENKSYLFLDIDKLIEITEPVEVLKVLTPLSKISIDMIF